MLRPFAPGFRLPVAVLACSVVACGALLLPHDAAATAITVTTTTDELNADGDCSLREAIRAANLNNAVDACAAGSDVNTDTITLASGATYALTIPGSSEFNALTGSLDVKNNAAVIDLVIDVAGGGEATISQDATPDDLVLNVANSASVELADLTIRGGTAPAGVSGGAITAELGSTLIVRRCVLEDNVAGNNGGAIQALGTLSVDAAVVRNNVAPNSAGGISGGSNATIAINDTLFKGNVARQQSGGAIRVNAQLVVTSSSFVDNTAGALGGAIASGSSLPGAVSITDSCLVGNTDLAIDSFNMTQQVATGNWWGTTDGPGGDGPGSGDQVSAEFSFGGFASAPPAACRPQELVADGTFGADADTFLLHWRTRPQSSAGVLCSATDCALTMLGIGTRKEVLQTLDVPGNAGDTFTFSARSAAEDVPASVGRYLVELRLIHADGSNQRKTLHFAPGTHGFEEKSKTLVASERYVRLKVRVEYGRASGTVTFDDISVTLE